MSDYHDDVPSRKPPHAEDSHPILRDALQPCDTSNGKGAVPLVTAPAQLVIGRRAAFAYIRECPLCGLDHAHGEQPFSFHPLTIFKNCDGARCAHCGPHGLGHIAKQVKGGRWTVVERKAPPYYRKPTEGSYRLVRVGPAIFTYRGAHSADARAVMADLARRGVPTSSETFKPRRPKLFVGRGD